MRDVAERTDDVTLNGTVASKVNKAVRINVTLNAQNYEDLKRLAAQLGTDMSEFVRDAIRIYAFLRREKMKGKSLYIGAENKIEKEIILL